MIEQIKEIETVIFQKFGKKVSVKYGKTEPLGDWFYLDRGALYGKFRLGTTVHNAVTMVGYMDSLPSGVDVINKNFI